METCIVIGHDIGCVTNQPLGGNVASVYYVCMKLMVHYTGKCQVHIQSQWVIVLTNRRCVCVCVYKMK